MKKIFGKTTNCHPGFIDKIHHCSPKRPADLAAFASLAISCSMLIQLVYCRLAPAASLTGEITQANRYFKGLTAFP